MALQGARAVAGGLLIAGLCAGCGSGRDGTTDGSVSPQSATTPIQTVDYLMFSSVEELAGASQVVLQGRVTGVLTREDDDGGSGLASQSFPVVFYGLQVERSSGSVSNLEPGAVIAVIGSASSSAIGTLPAEELRPGTEVVVFGVIRDSTNAPGIDTQKSYLAPTNGGASIFDVDGQTVTSRTEDIAALLATEVDVTVSPAPLRIPVAAMWEVINTVHHRK